MGKFMKAQPQQARLKISVYGPPGAGKTFTTLLMAEGLAKVRKKRIAFVDTERGTDFYAQEVKSRAVHPAAFDFDCLYTKSIAETSEAVRALDPNEHGIVVLDSISHLWSSAMDAYEGKKTKIESIPMHAWGKIKKPYKDLLNFLIGSQFDVFILGRQKNVFEDDENGEMKKIGVAMRAEGETAYEPHICMRMETQTNPADSTQSRVAMFAEKDRTGILSGRWFYNPNFETIEPLLPLLGETQAPAEDEDERQAKDAELMETAGNEKAKAKADKSARLMADLASQINAATDLKGIEAASKAIVKDKRYLMEGDQSTLRELYRSKFKSLSPAAAGDV
jgi:hypothetical protein